MSSLCFMYTTFVSFNIIASLVHFLSVLNSSFRNLTHALGIIALEAFSGYNINMSHTFKYFYTEIYLTSWRKK